MPSKKAKKPNHLRDGRHVASVSNDELWWLYRRGLADEKMVLKELVFRGDPQPKAYAQGYVSFKGGSQARVKLDTSKAQAKQEKPTKASNVRDAKKDRKKNGGEK